MKFFQKTWVAVAITAAGVVGSIVWLAVLVVPYAVDAITGARRIYITGLRSAAPLAQFMGYYLNYMFQNVHIITASGAGEMFEKVVGVNDYPGWVYNPDSELLKIFKEAWTETFGVEPHVVAIHAGLECGLLGEKIPGLDAVSIGPEMHDIHTSRERLGIASTARMWEFIKAVLKAL